ncbi:MAG: class I SAM-dependent methyltransferase, partial [Moorea sp. SIO3G5]|nr:class I SAM-dependent methyltransferase [Moorena sp. SIO3G5]
VVFRQLLEVGCGAGTFLYPFYQQGNPVAGIDYSANLVKIALAAMPQATISVGEAIDLPRDRQFDVVLSGGVFHYFPTYDYAAEVLRGMVQIAQKSIGILDVPDLSKQESAISARKAGMGDAEYEEKYRGLDHLYYTKDWFQQVLATESVQVTMEDQCLQGYDNSKYQNIRERDSPFFLRRGGAESLNRAAFMVGRLWEKGLKLV